MGALASLQNRTAHGIQNSVPIVIAITASALSDLSSIRRGRGTLKFSPVVSELRQAHGPYANYPGQPRVW
jgi:hypothetical protein